VRRGDSKISHGSVSHLSSRFPMKVVMTEFHPSVHSAAVNAVAGDDSRHSDQRAYRMTSIDIVRGLGGSLSWLSITCATT